jgi:hypothetical protein
MSGTAELGKAQEQRSDSTSTQQSSIDELEDGEWVMMRRDEGVVRGL